MSNSFHVTIAILVVVLLSCRDQSKSVGKSFQETIAIDTPRSFVKSYGEQDNPLFAFIGEKIFVEPIPTRQYSMDNCFRAKYVIQEKIYGMFLGDTIEFVVYDHYGRVNFSKYKNALLFVSADSGTYYHQKYMYNDVYKTKSGKWAGSYASDDYDHTYNKHTKIKPVKIDFAEEVSYPTKGTTEDGNEYNLSYPEPYFKAIGDKAFAVYGNYIDELFKLKKNGYLTARGLFEKKNKTE